MTENLALLEHKETNQISHPHGTYKQYLDDRAPAETLASKNLYAQIDALESSEKCWNLESCRQIAWFVRHKDTGEVRIASKKCHLRWCFHCAESRQAFITSAIWPWWSCAKQPKLLTLTLKHTSADLQGQIELLYKSFQKLRNRKLLRKKIAAGVWFFQITYNHETNCWHPHLHALLDSYYIEHSWLKTQWYKITNGSSIVHIKAVTNPRKTLRHHARYCARPSSLVDLDDPQALELYEAFKHRRIIGSWGKAKAISFRQQKPVDSDKWLNIGSWDYVVKKVGHDIRADRILFAWATGAKIDSGTSLARSENGSEERELLDAPEKIPKYEIQATLF